MYLEYTFSDRRAPSRMIHSRTSHWVNLEYSIYLGKFRTDITKYLEEINLDKFRYIQIYLEYNKLI